MFVVKKQRSGRCTPVRPAAARSSLQTCHVQTRSSEVGSPPSKAALRIIRRREGPCRLPPIIGGRWAAAAVAASRRVDASGPKIMTEEAMDAGAADDGAQEGGRRGVRREREASWG